MKIILVSHKGSECIREATQYLVQKYLPGFDPMFYYRGTRPIREWASDCADFLSFLSDEKVIFTLDDYLVADYIDMGIYNQAVNEVIGDVVCAKLCKSTEQEHLEYPVTTQYCIWNREYLISLLRRVMTPWEFEIIGSKLFDKKVILRTCLDYNCNSSLSGQWQGVKLTGLKDEDVNYIKTNFL